MLLAAAAAICLATPSAISLGPPGTKVSKVMRWSMALPDRASPFCAVLSRIRRGMAGACCVAVAAGASACAASAGCGLRRGRAWPLTRRVTCRRPMVSGILAERLQNPVGIIGLHPGAEEPRGSGQMRQILDDLLQLQPGEPGREHILADRSLEPGAHPVPEVALGLAQVIGTGHRRRIAFGCRCGGDGSGSVPILASGAAL